LTSIDSSIKLASLSRDALLAHFQVDPEIGLSGTEVETRLQQFGPNELENHGGISPWKILLAQFQDLMVLILLLATLVAFGSWWLDGAQGLPADGIVILLIVVANAWLGFTQEYKAEQIIQELQASTRATAKVFREGKIREITQEGLVPGDLVELSEGDLVPADLIVLNLSALKADESLLTGESVTVFKSTDPIEGEPPIAERKNELFAGTIITAGSGTGIVIQTGPRTELGKIADTLQKTTSEATPLERRLSRLGKNIGWGVLILTILIAGVVLLVEGRVDSATLIRVAMFSVALAVAAVPEGLPAVLTVGLSVGARRLAQSQVVCRQMSAVETLGSVTTIVTDKTGTLTENQMTVRALFNGTEDVQVTGDGYATEGQLSLRNDAVEKLIRCGVLASGGGLEKGEGGRNSAIGDPMDAAFLVLAEKVQLDWPQVRADWRQTSEIPFSSDRARICKVRESSSGAMVFVKGALQSVLPLCTQMEDGRPLDADLAEQIRAIEESYAKRALRCLALAQRELSSQEGEWEENLTFLGLSGFEDPPRADVGEAIQDCQRAGIRVIMCTGDHPFTAAAIGRRIGLPHSETHEVLTGSEVQRLSHGEFAEAVKDRAICARFSPAQKLALVEILIDAGEVVAMTGDGVNDAPALKKVHVGVAMGQGGTAVAVEASDLVLMDDKFSSIVRAVQEGRAVYHNIQRFIAFLFSGNFGVVVAMFVGTLLAGFFDLRYDGSILLPLSAAQILWMNLVTDGAPALAFALGRSTKGDMYEPPRDPKSPILTGRIWSLVALTGTVLAAVFLLLLDVFYGGGVWTVVNWDPVYTRSLAFYALVTARLLNAFNFQDLERSVFSSAVPPNLYLKGAVLLSWLLTLALVSFGGLAQFFGLAPLSFSHLLTVTATLPFVVFLPAELFKRFQGIRS
jgi:P-type Ca2+ transporter type 2C